MIFQKILPTYKENKIENTIFDTAPNAKRMNLTKSKLKTRVYDTRLCETGFNINCK